MRKFHSDPGCVILVFPFILLSSVFKVITTQKKEEITQLLFFHMTHLQYYCNCRVKGCKFKCKACWDVSLSKGKLLN